ncbi:Tetratricopeptide repeat protein 1 [Tetrabaena socialis]|uniref:Tetratricopeptide repeat protein 1 n=1 Tax=Tetrabaena socialis TaxID=47790 RepID=A0A2J7ZZ60_9CHLO|nr:Tetratricopeptide repeat protein 1 [Tetrabaena socialis]|eukprot:PNH05557.1 Tetratricopeptide repeat protein 1 [Tetrabaena socialis]
MASPSAHAPELSPEPAAPGAGPEVPERVPAAQEAATAEEGTAPAAQGAAVAEEGSAPAAQEAAAAGPGPTQEAGEGSAGELECGELEAADSAARLARADGLKREGNDLFGRGLWGEAATKYDEALDAAPPGAHKERAVFFANLAACNIKAKEPAAAIQNCTEAVQLDSSYQKAYMRRCEAYEQLDELDRALADAKALLELSPDSAWAKAKVAALQPVVDERTEKLKTEMLSKLKDLGNSILGNFGLSTDNFKFDKDPNTGSYSIKFQQ